MDDATYERNFALFSESLISYCKELVSEKYNEMFSNGMFDMWLNIDAGMDIGHIYIDKFKEHFGDNIRKEIQTQLFFAGKNISYAISSFIYIKNHEYKLGELLDFVETFVSEQVDGFDNDYDRPEYNGEEDPV
jgi:hypothetical protein